MPHFALTVTLKTDNGHKIRLESIIEELQEKGARILDIKSKAAKVGQPPMTVSTVTITYKAPKRIKLEE